MANPPLVSVVIPTYNGAAFAAEAVESALAQTFQSVEIIVVDDGSTDGTADLLKRRFGGRVDIVSKPNGGVSSARNAGVERARGEFIALLDHDDRWAPEKLELQMALFQRNPKLGLVFSDCHFEKDGQRLEKTFFQHHRPARGDIVGPLLGGNFIPALTAVFPKRVFVENGPFSEELSISEDYEFFLKAASSHEADYLDKPTATYRLHEGNYSRDTEKRINETLWVLGSFEKARPEKAGDCRSEIRRSRTALLHDLGYAYFNWGRLPESRRAFGRSLAINPLNPRAWVYIALSFFGSRALAGLKLMNRSAHMSD